jgi:hypothetical protein
MNRNRAGLAILLILIIAVNACKKTISYPAIPLTSYFTPMQVGKYNTYRLDSLNFYFYGQLDTVTSYLAKDSVEESFIDNSGRPSWRVVRYLSDTTGTLPWTASETYSVTPSVQTIEVQENNLRYIKLAFPMDEGFSWTGNTYLPYNPFQDFFAFSDDSHLSLELWDYAYQNVNKPFALGNHVYDSTATVLQVNDSINVPITDPNSFASRTYWAETYAKNVGLIYRHTELWEYQPPTPNGTQSGYKIGFEITLTLIDHN